MRRKIFKSLAVCMLSAALATGMETTAFAAEASNGVTVYQSDNDETFDPGGATYSRVICLKHSGNRNGTLLCTYDQLKNVKVRLNDGTKVSKQVYPIYRSTDEGKSWFLISNVYDREYNLLRTSQPFLFELPRQIGNMPAGTIILAGNIFDDNPFTQSHLVLYKSLDGGQSWSFLSQVDHGGPCIYDPGTDATTTAVWEPSLNISKDGKLVCYFSDERQKKHKILQAVSLRTSADGVHWGEEANVAAIPDQRNRPGMITVTSLPNGKYIASYEVVNQPGIQENNAVVYCKFSDDGIHWDAGDLGTRVALSDGRGIGSSPYIKWIDAGGPNGMVVISAKWATDKDDHINGGQNFYVNYNFGKGTWERLPMAVTYDFNDSAGGYFSGFSQSFDTSPDNKILYQATNVENLQNKKTIKGRSYNLNDVKVGKIPLTEKTYEAENAKLTDVRAEAAADASNGKEARYINNADSKVCFENISVPKDGTYTVNVRYSNGEGKPATHKVIVNNGQAKSIKYNMTANWDRYQWTSFTAELKKGTNRIEFCKDSGYAEIDCITVADVQPDYSIINENSGKYLEVTAAEKKYDAGVGQWGVTNNLCQDWEFESAANGYYRIKNLNSGLYLDIEDHSTANGAKATQYSKSDQNSQLWKISDHGDGYFYIINKNSGKYLEVQNNLKDDGAAVGQWDNTGYGCQRWKLISEGTK